MEITFAIAIFIFLGAIICELIDSSLGMLYGTILSPALIIFGFEPLMVVPAILFSQAIGGFTASIMHQRFKNVDFRGKSQDLKISFWIVSMGIFATILAALIAVNIPKVVLKSYIGLLILIMGVILLSKTSFKFSWKKVMGIGILSAFNKAISGGGFGPVVTSGQVIGGQNGKNSIGVTTLAEVPICLAGFLTYFFSKGIVNWNFIFLLSTGAIIGALIGPFFTAKFKSEEKLKLVLGVLVILLGIFVLVNTWFLNIKGVGA